MWMQMASLKCMASGQIWRVLIRLTISSSAVFYLLVSRCFGSMSVNVRPQCTIIQCFTFSQSSSFQVTNKVVWWHPPNLWCLWCFGSRLLIWCASLLSQESSEIKGKDTFSFLLLVMFSSLCLISKRLDKDKCLMCFLLLNSRYLISFSIIKSPSSLEEFVCVHACVRVCFYNAWSTNYLPTV